MQYLEIPFATLIGWLIFAIWPNAMPGLGICIVMAAGLYVVLRERATSRARPVPPAQADPAQLAAE
jgi:drug/metabolite transporter (DMT)-like permease